MTDDIKVSAVISTFNRYAGLMQAIEGVRWQTHKNIEIIVINDGSTEEAYQNARPRDVIWIDQEKNSRDIFCFPCLGYVRNLGIPFATGEYIAFLDDDDMWMPDKTRLQLKGMENTGCEMSCTEGLMGDSLYDPSRSYPVYHREYYGDFCRRFFEQHRGIWRGILPSIFKLDLIRIHNFIIHSSVLIRRRVLDLAGRYRELPLGGTMIDGERVVEDWDMWKRCLEHTDCLHLNQPLVYYDGRLSKTR